MFRKGKNIQRPYGILFNYAEEKRKYNKLYHMKKDSEFKTYSEWSEYILEKWKNDNHINNFIGLKHYLILLKNNAEALNSVPIDMISFVFGGVLGGISLQIKTYPHLISFVVLIGIIEISMMFIKYNNRRTISLFSDLIDLADCRINQIKEQNYIQVADEQCPTQNSTTKKP